MEYIRFGELPEDEKSINYFSNEKEKGVSVFEKSEAEKPLLKNLRLASSMAARLDSPVYLVSGDLIGIGNDEEPLLVNVKKLKEIKMGKQEKKDYLYLIMCENFETMTGQRECNDHGIQHFCSRTRKCKKCGKKVWEYGICCSDDWKDYEKVETHDIYFFDGVEFTNPVENFETMLGYNKKISNS